MARDPPGPAPAGFTTLSPSPRPSTGGRRRPAPPWCNGGPSPPASTGPAHHPGQSHPAAVAGEDAALEAGGTAGRLDPVGHLAASGGWRAGTPGPPEGPRRSQDARRAAPGAPAVLRGVAGWAETALRVPTGPLGAIPLQSRPAGGRRGQVAASRKHGGTGPSPADHPGQRPATPSTPAAKSPGIAGGDPARPGSGSPCRRSGVDPPPACFQYRRTGTEDSRLPFLAQPAALATDVEHAAVAAQPVEDRQGDDGVAQELVHGRRLGRQADPPRSRLCSALAFLRSSIRSQARTKQAPQPRLMALWARAAARWVRPTPGGPRSGMPAASATKARPVACRQRCPGWPVRRILRIPADTGNSPENGFHPHFPARVLSFRRSFLILGRKIRSFLAKPRRTLTAEPEIFPVHPKFARQTSTENSFCRRFSRSLLRKLHRKTRFWGSSIKNFCILSIHVEKIVYI